MEIISRLMDKRIKSKNYLVLMETKEYIELAKKILEKNRDNLFWCMTYYFLPHNNELPISKVVDLIMRNFVYQWDAKDKLYNTKK